MSNSLPPRDLQQARPPCPSPTPGVYSNSCPSSRWRHPDISSSGVPFSSCPQSLPASGSFPVSQLFALGGQSIGVSASAWPLQYSCLENPMNPVEELLSKKQNIFTVGKDIDKLELFALLVGTWNEVTAMANSMMLLQKIKNRIIVWSAILLLNLKIYLYTRVHSSTIHNS